MNHLTKFLVLTLLFTACNSSKPIQLNSFTSFGDNNFEICDSELSQNPVERGANYIKFSVQNVEKALEPLEEVSYQEALESSVLPSEMELFMLSLEEEEKPAEEKPAAKLEDFSSKDYDLVKCYRHPFVEAVYMAYAEHRPLVISPDMIWLMLVQGLGIHINENAEALRDHFVDFTGKTHLDVRRDNFVMGVRGNDWEGVFTEFQQKIEEYTGPEITGLVSAEFSTTSPAEKAAFEITLMDAMDQYFSYGLTVLCGIPEITLEGTVDDWKQIETKAAEMAQYDLGWWIQDMLPILGQFTEAAKGNVDREFWAGIFQRQSYPSGCTSVSYLTGWLVKFFPYLISGKNYVRNPMIGNSTGDFLEAYRDKGKKYYRYTGPEIEFDELPGGLSQADLLVNENWKFYKLDLVAGFIGIQQDLKSLSLRPEIAWAIVDNGEKATDQDLKQYFKTNPPPKGTVVTKM